MTGKWIGDCFVFTTGTRVNYLVGDEVYPVRLLLTINSSIGIPQSVPSTTAN
jgi:hypothetical protein